MTWRVAIMAVIGLLSGAPIGAPAQPASPPPAGDITLARTLAVIRAHLAVGDELMRAGEWRAAVPHFRFPTEEDYGIIRADIAALHLRQFDGALKALARAVAARNAKRVASGMAAVGQALDAAEQAAPARPADRPGGQVEVAVALLRSAADEYDEAVTADRVVRPVQYQTARGLIVEANRLIAAAAPALSDRSPSALDAIRPALADLTAAVPGAVPPRTPTADAAAVAALVDRIARAAAPSR